VNSGQKTCVVRSGAQLLQCAVGIRTIESLLLSKHGDIRARLTSQVVS